MKNREFRELQVSSTQLAIIFFGILIIGVVIFLLGVSVGKKHAQASIQTAAVAQKAADQVRDRLVVPERLPAATPAPAETAKEAPEAKGSPAQEHEASPPAADAASAEKAAPQTPAEKPSPKAGQTAGQAAAPAAAVTHGAPAPQVKDAVQPSPEKPASVQKPAPAEETKKAPVKAEAAPAAPPKKGLYYVQVGALATKAEAGSVAQKLRTRGYSVVILEPSAADKKVIFRVRVGGFGSKEEAEAARAKLVAAAGKKVDYFLVRD